MKSINLLWVALVMFGLFACDDNKPKEKSPQYDLSYAYGSMVGTQLATAPLATEEKDAEKFAEGFMKALEGDAASTEEARKALEPLQTRQAAPTEVTDKEAAKQTSYYLAIAMIGGLAQEVEIPKSDFDQEAIAEGFRDAVAGDSLELEIAYRDSILRVYMEPKGKEYQEKMEAKQQAEAQVNIDAGQKFLEENKSAEGVQVTESGLQYKVLQKGTGKQPTADDKVKVNYQGTLIDGTVFDSSYERGQPASFGLKQVIAGWTEGIPLMKEGAKYQFFIPQELAYGMRPMGESIPAGSTLIFEVELLEVNPEPMPTPMPGQ